MRPHPNKILDISESAHLEDTSVEGGQGKRLFTPIVPQRFYCQTCGVVFLKGNKEEHFEAGHVIDIMQKEVDENKKEKQGNTNKTNFNKKEKGTPVIVRFVPPGKEELVVNVDAGIKIVEEPKYNKFKIGGVGAVSRMNNRFIEARSIFLGVMTNSTLVAECIAILEGLLMAEAEKKRISLRFTKKLEKAVVRSDSSEAVDLVNNRTLKLPAKLVDIIQACRDVLDSNPEFSVEFVYREGNVIADILATIAVRFRFSQKWVGLPPDCIGHALELDAGSVGRVRKK